MIPSSPTQVIVIQQLGDSPVYMNCPACHRPVITRVRHLSGLLTHLMCGLFCIFGCFPGCCLLPYFIPALKDVEHVCPVCGVVIARVSKL
ncbi:hypothetical protein FBUS_04909 [Fasciolopsis buskii]|uniref:LITAF domain-containing protein n=1 Tax=Fasciolopsis buskii TaxID=27845 RepID=A0A8E0VEC7_9TREM|nr:hypothetical protein FBUS_04909 [Fasciolopsis buski]